MPDPKLYLNRAPRIADMINAWFCPQCGLRDETARGIDQDGTCSSCGSDCCTWDSVRGHLAHYGWEVVSADDARELYRIRAEATAEPSDMKKRERGCECHLEEGDSPCIVHGLYEADQPPLRTREKWDPDDLSGAIHLAVDSVHEPASVLSRVYAAIARVTGRSPRAELTGEERAVLEAVEEAKRRLLVMIESLEADEDGTTDNDLLLVDLDGIRNVLARRAARKESKP